MADFGSVAYAALNSGVGRFSGGVAGAALSAFREVTGPALGLGFASLRFTVGYNDLAEARRIQYAMNYVLGEPVKMSVEQLLRSYNQTRIGGLAGEGAAVAAALAKLQDNARYQGVNFRDADWGKVADMSATAAPLGDVIRSYWRDLINDTDSTKVDEAELDYQLSRHGMRRGIDRDVAIRPYYGWSPATALALYRRGWINQAQYDVLLKAAGVAKPDDQEYWRKVSQPIPPAGALANWASHARMDEFLAQRYGLDNAIGDSALPEFFATAQGDGQQQEPLPNQPGGTANWYKLNLRASRSLPGWGMARVLLHRLRPDAADPENSVVPGSPPWTEQNCRDMLALEGYPEEVIQSIIGTAYEPLNLRFTNHILLPYYEHTDFKRQVDASLGPDAKWVDGAMLDHGFDPKVAALAAEGLRRQTWDAANAEKIAWQKKLREENRAIVLKKYEQGTISIDNAKFALVDQFIDDDMAQGMLANVDQQIAIEFVATATNEIKKSFLAGKLSLPQVGAQLTALGVSNARMTLYVQEWVWARNDQQRVLATGDILKALKDGFITPAVALVRLTNIGWTAPDAMVEITLAEHDVAQAQAKVAAKNAAQIIAAEQRAARAALAAKKAADKAAAIEAAKKKRHDDAVALVDVKQDIATDAYNATALLDRVAYDKAVKDGNADKMEAEISKAEAAYGKLLLAQLKMSQLGPEAESALKIVEPVPIPANPPAKGTG